jgi:hypothetical protein
MMTNTKTNRAPKGGTVGVNGEFYEGGTFLPTTTLGKMARATRKASTRQASILDTVRAFISISFDKTTATVTANDSALTYYGKTRSEVQAIVDRYNGGER